MTNPTADAAKLLDELQMTEAIRVAKCWLADGKHGGVTQILCRAVLQLSTPPRPAPPAGEPDFHRWLDQKIAEWSAAGGFHDFAVAAKVIRDRLGLAARPKVEDAEVAAAITYLGDEVPEEKAIADLLERLAGYLSDMTADFKDQATKLAECEAELAKADAVIVHSAGKDAIALDHWYAWQTEAEIRHAARQQQQKASAEPTEREGE